MKLYGTVRQIPADHRGGHDLETVDVETEATTYDLALEALQAQVPEGWQLIGISRWPTTGDPTHPGGGAPAQEDAEQQPRG